MDGTRDIQESSVVVRIYSITPARVFVDGPVTRDIPGSFADGHIHPKTTLLKIRENYMSTTLMNNANHEIVYFL